MYNLFLFWSTSHMAVRGKQRGAMRILFPSPSLSVIARVSFVVGLALSEGQTWDRARFQMYKGLYHLEKNVLESTSYLLPLASKTSLIE